MLEAYRGKAPVIENPCFVAGSAVIIGDVTIGRRCSIWPGAVLRGDLNSIAVGEGSSIQDNCVVHVDHVHNVRIGNGVTVGHGAMLHGCSVGDGTLIGIAATVLDGAEVGEYSIVGAGAV
ncbi:MAG: gamma carbonic anhydrase family protein, partial [Bacillota bacterium]